MMYRHNNGGGMEAFELNLVTRQVEALEIIAQNTTPADDVEELDDSPLAHLLLNRDGTVTVTSSKLSREQFDALAIAVAHSTPILQQSEAHHVTQAFGDTDARYGATRARQWKAGLVSHPYDVMGWRERPPKTIAEAVGQAIGAGSTCFERGTIPEGVFDDRRARLIVEQLLGRIEEYGDERVAQEREKQVHATNDAAFASVDFEPPVRYAIELRPVRMDVYANNVRVGAVSGGGDSWGNINRPHPRDKRPLSVILRTMLDDMRPIETDKISDRDIRITFAAPSLNATSPEAGHDEEEEEDNLYED